MKAGWLKAAMVQVNSPKESVIAALRSRLVAPRPSRSRSTVHASDVTKPGFCPREWALLDLLPVKKSENEFASAALRATWDVGAMTANLLIQNWAQGIAVGNWYCVRCKATRQMSHYPAGACGDGSAHVWEYREVSVFSKELGISGSLDVLLDLGTPRYMMVELKIISPEEFATLVAPLPEHRVRTALYLKLMADSDHPYKEKFNLHEARVLYVSRGYGKMNQEFGEVLPFREFVVKRDDASIADLLERARGLQDFRQKGVMPVGVCSTAVEKRAQKCSVCKACFSGDYPPKKLFSLF